jgi:hypothetical protein
VNKVPRIIAKHERCGSYLTASYISARYGLRARAVVAGRIRSRATIRHAKKCTTFNHETQPETCLEMSGLSKREEFRLWRIASRILTLASFNQAYVLQTNGVFNGRRF